MDTNQPSSEKPDAEKPSWTPKCPICEDTGWMPVGNRKGNVDYRPCPCQREKGKRDRLAEANIQDGDRYCTLERFIAYNESLESALAKARQLAETFPASGYVGLFFEGPPGVGKTHLAVAVLKRILERTAVPGQFHKTRELLKRLRSSYEASVAVTEMQILDPILAAPVLVLDDLGAEKASDWVFETLDYLIDSRASKRCLTLFTSNVPDRADRTDPHTLVFKIGERAYSRLHQIIEFVYLDGADYRKAPPNAGPDDLVTMWKRDQLDPQPRSTLPSPRFGHQARAQLRDDHRADLKWPGGRAGS
jgi:DNA replication protein DnaC